MPANTIPIQQMIQNAAEAMRRGDKRTARTWAQIAASSAPEIEEPWLILAAVSGPRASIEYLKQALLVNPGSQRATRGLRWAQARLAKQQAQQPAAAPMSATQPVLSITRPIPTRRPQASPALKPARRKLPVVVKWLSMPALFLILMCIVTAWAVWPGSTSSALALIRSGAGSGASGPAWSLAEIAKPTYTPIASPLGMATVTSLPSATSQIPPTAGPLPTSTATFTPVPTDTSTPTALPTDLPVSEHPTDVPTAVNVPIIGNYTVQAGDTLSGIAQRAGVSVDELAAANQIGIYTTIYAGQVLGIPQGGMIPDPNPAPAPAPDDPIPASGEKYILVDISEQHLYAYEGDTLVYSFVVSTGMNNSTRTGFFQVLDKIPNAYGATWDLWMPNWMGIYYSGGLENGFHALPILSSGARLWSGYLGTPISFGCIVLGVEEAEELYNWADVGTTVEIRW